MESRDQQLRNPSYRNWVKASLALKDLKDGIEEFVDAETKEHQTIILEEVQKELGRPGATCNECAIDQLRAHKRGRYKMKNFCQNDVCDKIFDKIVKRHMYDRPSWSNTDSTKWCTDHWQIAKCFIDGGGYGDKGSASDTDCKGLLSIITNNTFVQSNVDTPIDKIEPKTDVFSKSKEARNEILHIASLQLSSETLNNFVDVMIQLLEDKGKLHEYENAKQAILKLRQLKQTDLFISTEDEWEARKSALKAVQERKQEALDEIEKKQGEVLEKLQIDKIQETLDDLSKTSKETSQSFSNRHESLEQRQTVLESTLKQTQKLQEVTSKSVVQLQQGMAHLQKDLSDLKARFDAFDEIELQHKKRVTYLDHKKDIKQELFNMYSKYLLTTPVPLLQNLDVKVNEFYMNLEICNDNVYEDKIDERKKNYYYSTIVTNYHDIFYKKGERVENIYVLGDAGVGKTTWCLNLIDTWLRGSTNKETEYTFSSSLNKEMMLEFDVVLFVSLKHTSNEVDLTHMIQKQIFHQTPHLFEYMQEVLNTEPDKCLVIADGLDEWNAPDDQMASPFCNDPSFPGRKNMNHCTVLTTSRPWKLNEAKPNYSLIDRAIVIRGFDGIDSVRGFAEKVIDKLNKNDLCDISTSVRNERQVDDFEQELQKRLHLHCFLHYNRVVQNPFILILMVLKWFEDGSLESSMAGNYSFMMKSLFDHEEGYRNIKPKYGRTKKRDGRLSCIRNIEQAKLKWSTDAEKLPECVKKHSVCCQYSRLILKLSEIAFEGLFDRNYKALIFSEESLLEKLSSEEVEVAVKSGILSKSDVVGQCNVSKLSFLHKTVQEFMAAIHLVSHDEDDSCGPYQKFEKYCSKYRIYEMENVLLFSSGLNANLTVNILKHFTKVENQNVFFGKHVSSLLYFVGKCIKELRVVSPDASMPVVPLDSFISCNDWHFDELLDMLETCVDKGSVMRVGVSMCDDDGPGPNKLLDILSSEICPLFNLTTLQLEHISGKCLFSRTNKRVVFNLPCLRYLVLTRINTKNKDEKRLTNVVLDFSHSWDIESVNLKNIFSCQINFCGTNLKKLNLEHLVQCHVRINDDVAILPAENKQTISRDENHMHLMQCINVDCISVLNCYKSKVCINNPGGYYKKNDLNALSYIYHKLLSLSNKLYRHIKQITSNVYGFLSFKKYGTAAQTSVLTFKNNMFCEVELNIGIESVSLMRPQTVPNLHWNKVKKITLEEVIHVEKIVYDAVLQGITCSQNLTSLQCIGCKNDVISDIFKAVGSISNLSNLEINGNRMYTDKNVLVRLTENHLEVKGLGLSIVEYASKVEVISKFSSVETLELSNVSRLPKNGIVSVRSLENLKCLKFNRIAESDFILLGECFQCLKNLKELELLCFDWNKVENRSAFSCLEKLDNLKTLSVREFSQKALTSAMSVCLPELSSSTLLLDCFSKCKIQCLNNMKMLKKLTLKITFEKDLLDCIVLLKKHKDIESLKIFKPFKLLYPDDNHLKLFFLVQIDLSELEQLKHFLIEDVYIGSSGWQTFVKGLPNNGQLKTLEFLNAVILDEETEQMIQSTSGFKCQKWECVKDDTYNIILKVK